jgi:transcriptional regulator with PAS, ATPase and Fis domain
VPGVVGVSREMQECCTSLKAVAESQVNVLIHGESGTGKEVLARAVHELGPRRSKRFLGVNCAALPESLFESELFGHKAGAFTGAGKEKTGLLEAADGGTFFLDEIGDMPVALQIKLLRVMQERKLRRIGELRSRSVDLRFVAASHKDLPAEIEAGRFRLDLYYRLNVVLLHIPPLRQRPEDVAHLLAFLLRRKGLDPADLRIAPDALAALQRYRWPGNVRELENEVLRWLALHAGAACIELAQLSPGIQSAAGRSVDPADLGTLRPMEEATELLERYLIRKAIGASEGRKSDAARRLGLSRQGLYKKIKRYGMRDLLQPTG